MSELAVHDCQSLTEQIRDWKSPDVLVDQENRIVKNVALTGRESSNGYRYSEQALREGLPLYENKPVFLDHAASQSRPHQRSTRDLVGSIVNVRYEEGRVRGDIRVLDTEAGRTFLALAESNGPAVGMSHVVLAEKNADGSVVEKIHEVVSVDAVVFPATTKSFHEQQAGDDISLAADLARLIEERDAIQQQLASLQRELAKLKTKREVELLLDQARLPQSFLSEIFRQQLLAADSMEARRMLIQERRHLLDSLTPAAIGPHSQERLADDHGGPKLTDEQLISAIRRG